MKKSQKIILAFLGLILVVAASGLVAKKYVDQKAAKQERVVVTSNALAEIFWSACRKPRRPCLSATKT